MIIAMKHLPRSFALSVIALIAPSTAFAHTLLVDPPPLIDDSSAKTAPCGCEVGGLPPCPANFPITEVVAGQTYTVKWKEPVNHAGSFRIAFSTKPVDTVAGADLDANVLADMADNNTDTMATLTTQVTIPNTPCDTCTLQLRQFMDGAASPYYYSCASLRVIDPNGGSGGAGSSSSSSSSSGSGQGGDNGEGGSTGPGMGPAPTPIETGNLCSLGAPSNNTTGLFTLAALSALALLRRRSQPSTR